MIGTTPSGHGAPLSGSAAAFGVRTNALDQACDALQRAVDRGRQLLEHPGRVRGRAQDAGDEGVRDAVVAFADRWQWGLEALVEDAAGLARDIRVAARLYDEVERTSVPISPAGPAAGR